MGLKILSKQSDKLKTDVSIDFDTSNCCVSCSDLPMHNVQKDWIGATVIAALGAGIITSFAVSQGQNPLIGLGITIFAAISAVTIDHFL